MKKEKRKGKGLKMFLIILASILVIGGISLAVGFSKVMKEHKEIMALSLNEVNFSNLKDGTYVGGFEGGMYKWRENEIKLTVNNGKVSDIEVLSHKEGVEKEFLDNLFGQVIENQTFEVDTVSGATITSRAYLKGAENTLKKAEKK